MFCLVSFFLFVFSFSSGEVLLGLSRVLCPAFSLIFVFYRFHSNLSLELSGVFSPFFKGGGGGVPHVFPWCLLWSFGEAGFDSHVNGRTGLV